jgi:thioesterase domain-containing protein/acyl carrier protein
LVASIDWDAFREEEAPVASTGNRLDGRTDNGGGGTIAPAGKSGKNAELSLADGVDAFDRVLQSGLSQVIVTPQDMEELMAQSSISMVSGPVSLKDVEVDSIPRSVHPRPKLSVDWVAPRNALERNLAEIWQKFFGIDSVGIHDDFFSLGGDSLLAVQLVSKLRQATKIELPSHALLSTPTIATLAELITQATAGPASISLSKRPMQALLSSLVRIKTGSLPRPFFLIPPVGGHVYFYRDLAHCLPPDQPVYGLQAQGVDGKGELLTQVEEMAAQYIDAIRLVQSKGPYLIGGASFGGAIAYEMAQQIRSLNEEVELLVMMDTPGPGSLPDDASINVDRLAYLLSGDPTVSASPGGQQEQQLPPDEELMAILKRNRVTNRMFRDFALPQLSRFRQIVQTNTKAFQMYTPRGYPGRIIYFKAGERDTFTSPTPERGWLDLAAGGVELHEVPGNHITMNFPPNVEVMAELIKKHLETAQRAAAVTPKR